MRRRKINLESNRYVFNKHVRIMHGFKRQSLVAYKFIVSKMIADIIKYTKKEKLAKSDDLGIGWTSNVPKIEIDLEDIYENVIDKYLNSLKWVLLGDFSGKEAIEAADDIEAKDMITPGLIIGAYLATVDMHRQHYFDVMGKYPENLPPDLIKESMDQIVGRTNRYLDQVLVQMRNSILESVNHVVNDINGKNVARVYDASSKLDELSDASVAKLARKGDKFLDSEIIEKELKTTLKNFENNWERTTAGELGLSSATATHQSVQEIYGGKESSVKVVWMTAENDRVCKFCHNASKDSSGNYKYYSLSDFKPAGYNIGRKRDSWELSIPPSHNHCFCSLLYVPKGFKVEKGGDLVKDD